MFNELCDDAHEAHSMNVIHRTCMVIGITFLSIATFAITTRLGAGAPPASVTYGTEKPGADAVVFGD